MIEKSPAFKDGGLIDVTFDEGNPPFTYTGNSFNNANAYGPTLGDKPNASAGITADAAGENINGQQRAHRADRPELHARHRLAGNQLYPGPGNNSFIDRPPACTSTSPDADPANCVPGIVRGGSGTSPSARTDAVAGNTSSSFIEDKAILADDTGRQVTDTVDPSGHQPIPANTFVGAVPDTGPQFPTTQHRLGHQRVVPARRPERLAGHARPARSRSSRSAPRAIRVPGSRPDRRPAVRRHATRRRAAATRAAC